MFVKSIVSASSSCVGRGVSSACLFAQQSSRPSFVAVGFHHVYFDRTNLPDIGPFARFEFPAIGHVYDANDQPLIEMAREYRRNIKYEDIPPIVRDAILATEDKNFFSHSGVDYSTIPRVLSKVRIGASGVTPYKVSQDKRRSIAAASSRKADRRSRNSSCGVIFLKS